MSDVTITVRGESETRIAPERAAIHISVRAEGPVRATVVEQAMARAEPVRASITAREEMSAITEWTSSRLTVRAERPWNADGTRLAPLFSSSIDFTATFAEASELSLWVSEISPWDGVDVGWVNWHLTLQTRTEIERDVASAAVGVAVRRAEAYASALGLASVTPREIAGTGLISQESALTPQMMHAPGAVSAGAVRQIEHAPEDIMVSATVEARFTAR